MKAFLPDPLQSGSNRCPTQCVSFSDTIDGVNKDRAVEKSLKSLGEQIEKWKANNGVTGPVTVTAENEQALELGSAASQLAIVLASAAIITGLMFLVYLAAGLGIIGAGLGLIAWLAPTMLHL
jgi:hypothetical protein